MTSPTPTNPQAVNPELGLGDVLKFFQTLTEAVLTGAAQVPVIRLKVAGRQVDVGPTPISIK